MGAKNEAAATQLVADLDLGLGKPTALARSDAFVGEGETRWLKSQRRRCSLAGDGGAGAGRAGVDVNALVVVSRLLKPPAFVFNDIAAAAAC